MKTCLNLARLTVLSIGVSAAFAAGAQVAEADLTGTRVAGPREAQPFGISVITADDIQRIGATTVNDAIIRLLGAGSHLDFFGAGEYSLDLRGFGKTADSNQVVMLDGVRIKESDFDAIRLAGIPIDSVAKIEVIRGSGGVLYGSGSTGGVISITTKGREGQTRVNSASLYGAVGSNRMSEARANATVSRGGFSLDINAARRNGNNDRDNYWSGSGALSLLGQWKNDWLRLGVSHSQDGLNAGLAGLLTPAVYQANPRTATTPTDSVVINNVRQGLFGEMRSGDWKFFADAGMRNKKLRNVLQGKYGGGYDVKGVNYALRAVHQARQASFSNSLILGTDYARWQRETPAVPAALVATQVSRGFYARDELTLASSGTTLSAGVRTERVTGHNDNAIFGSRDISDPLTSWELGINQPVSKEVSVYGRVGRSFRVAQVEEFNYTPFGVILKPQRSRDTEIGSRYAAGRVKLDARIYRSAITDEIGYDLARFTSIAAFGANVNFDPTLRTGLEAEGVYEWSDSLGLRVNTALRKSRFVGGVYAGKELVRTPARMLGVHADWRPMAKHLLSGGVTAFSAQRLDIANLCAMPGYTVADVRYAYQFREAEISLAIANLFDRRFFTKAECDAPVAGAPGSGGITSSIFPEPGRALRLAVRFQF
ncbi:MAG: TonB-dependent receptor [Pseudomonadota bacterium]